MAFPTGAYGRSSSKTPPTPKPSNRSGAKIWISSPTVRVAERPSNVAAGRSPCSGRIRHRRDSVPHSLAQWPCDPELPPFPPELDFWSPPLSPDPLPSSEPLSPDVLSPEVLSPPELLVVPPSP